MNKIRNMSPSNKVLLGTGIITLLSLIPIFIGLGTPRAENDPLFLWGMICGCFSLAIFCYTLAQVFSKLGGRLDAIILKGLINHGFTRKGATYKGLYNGFYVIIRTKSKLTSDDSIDRWVEIVTPVASEQYVHKSKGLRVYEHIKSGNQRLYRIKLEYNFRPPKVDKILQETDELIQDLKAKHVKPFIPAGDINIDV